MGFDSAFQTLLFVLCTNINVFRKHICPTNINLGGLMFSTRLKSLPLFLFEFLH